MRHQFTRSSASGWVMGAAMMAAVVVGGAMIALHDQNGETKPGNLVDSVRQMHDTISKPDIPHP